MLVSKLACAGRMPLKLWCFALVVMAAADAVDCEAVGLLNLPVGQECSLKWTDAQPITLPSQNSVGYAWVQAIVEEHMEKKHDAQKTMDGKIVPVVLGPARKAVYILDHHHHLSALDFTGFDVKVTFHMVCDYSNKTSDLFWARMAELGYAYLWGRPDGSNDLPTAITPGTLPKILTFNKTGTVMKDDRWRSLAGFVRKISSALVSDDYGARCYNRACNPSTGSSIPFFEYRFDGSYCLTVKQFLLLEVK